MDPYQAVVAKLNELNMPFQTVEHPPAMTTAEADQYIKGIDGVRTKSLFLTNKKKTAYYLVILDDTKQLDMNRFMELIGEKRIHMASEKSLMEKMKLPAGTVSIFGLLNNADKNIKVYFDRPITTEQRMSFHPNINTKTIFVNTTDIFKFLKNIGFEYSIVEL